MFWYYQYKVINLWNGSQVLVQNQTKIKLIIWHCLKTLFIFSITKSKKNINTTKVSSSYAESIPSSDSRKRQKEDKYSLTPLKTILSVYIRPSVEAWASLWSAAAAVVATAEIWSWSQYQLYMAVEPGNCCLKSKLNYFSKSEFLHILCVKCFRLWLLTLTMKIWPVFVQSQTKVAKYRIC